MSNLNDEADIFLEEGERCFRAPRQIIYIFVGLSVFWVVSGIALSSAVALGIVARFPLVPFWFGDTVFALVVPTIILMKLTQWKSKLIITPEKIVDVGLFRTKTIRFDEIETVNWGLRFPGFRFACLQLVSSDRKIRFDLDASSEEQQREIVYLLHTAFDAKIQKGWDRFEELHYSAPESCIAHYWKFHLHFELIIIGYFFALASLSLRNSNMGFVMMACPALLALAYDLAIYMQTVKRYFKARKENKSSDET